MNILLFATAYNGMCQRVDRELQRDGHSVYIELSPSAEVMEETVARVGPDLIICPFLKHRVPESIWSRTPCLIVHPGIEGDRGPSSMDWAITQGLPYWGVTLLQAETEMDAGDIWGTGEFPLRLAGKASLYRREVIGQAVALIRSAIERYQQPSFQPRPLDYSRPDVRGRLLPLMSQTDRCIDWRRDNTETVLRKIRAADGFPGVLDSINGEDFYLYGASTGKVYAGAAPGEVLGQAEGAICRATVDGSVWIRQMKKAPEKSQRFFKLPAMQALSQSALVDQFSDLPSLHHHKISDIGVRINDGVATVCFDFYNGAMNTHQCRALASEIRVLKQRREVKVIVLMGGEDFWSNGIHLNCIEAAEDPARESWLNINAIDDLVWEIITAENQITVAALRNNAGAGGAIVPLACDFVVGRSGVVLNPHYQTMGLYGSEYWTYLLPRRVGADRARSIMDQCLPLLTDDALTIGMVDELLPESWGLYHRELNRYCEELVNRADFESFLSEKKVRREADENHCPLARYRGEELRHMKRTFDNPDSDYHRLRYQFVHKISCGRTPSRLVREPSAKEDEFVVA